MGIMNRKSGLEMKMMSWKEVEEAIEKGKDTALIMMGSFEQHGPHMPLNTDTIISDELGKRIAQKLEYVLVAPTIRPGVSNHHMDFPGTISFSSELFMGILEEYCLSLEKHGVDFIALAPFHGGNFAPTDAIAPKISKKLNEAKILLVSDLDRNTEVMQESLKESGIEYDEKAIHAGATETSVLLAINEGYVDEERLQKGYEGSLDETSLFTEGLKHYTDNGVLGDPRKASKKAGEAILENLSSDLADRIDEKRKKLMS